MLDSIMRRFTGSKDEEAIVTQPLEVVGGRNSYSRDDESLAIPPILSLPLKTLAKVGDTVLIECVVEVVKGNAFHLRTATELAPFKATDEDIVKIVKPKFIAGDKVKVDNKEGFIQGIDGERLWVRYPATVEGADPTYGTHAVNEAERCA